MKKVRKVELDIAVDDTPSPGRKATKFEGVYFRWGKYWRTGKDEKVFYVLFTRKGSDRQIEARVGGQFSDEMNESRAAGLRELYLKGGLTRKEERDAAKKSKKDAAEAEASRKTFNKLFDAYMAHNTGRAEGYAKEQTDRTNYRIYLQAALGSKTPSEVEALDIQRVRKVIEKRKVAPATAHGILSLINRLAAHGTRELKTPPLNAQVTLPEVHNEKTETLTAEETARLMKILRDGFFTDKKGVRHEVSRDARDIVTIAINTGMRRGEILKTEWRNVNFEQGHIYCPRPKERKPKYIHLNPEVVAVLKSRENSGSAFVFPCRTWKEKDGHLVDPKRSLNQVKTAARLPADFRPAHGYRHVFASTLMSARTPDGSPIVDLLTVSNLLGHSTVQMTQRYSHLASPILKGAVNAMSQILSTPAPVKDEEKIESA